MHHKNMVSFRYVIVNSMREGLYYYNYFLRVMKLPQFFVFFSVGWGTALQVGGSRVRSPMVSFNFSLTQSFWPHCGPGVDSASNRNSTRNISWGVKAAGTLGWQPYHLHVLSWNRGTSTSWNPQGLSRPVMGLLYLYVGLFILQLACTLVL